MRIHGARANPGFSFPEFVARETGIIALLAAFFDAFIYVIHSDKLLLPKACP
jgi:hypothetical protein